MKELALLIVIAPIVYGIVGLFYWGVGNLVIYVFGLSYTWTYLHGLVFALVVGILKSIFNSGDR